MTIDDLREKGLIVLQCISGSRAYGLHTPTSDTDIKGVFVLPKEDFYSRNYVPQVNNETNDIVFYELGRFLELLSVNNPNILELLYTTEESILSGSEFIRQIDATKIISKKCRDTFGKFALSQIKKAKGLNKKIVNPIDEKRKSPLDFCYVNYGAGSVSLPRLLHLNSWQQEHCGLVKIPNMKDIYGLYYNIGQEYSGVVSSSESNDISLSAIPKGEEQVGLLYFNRDGYSTYCKDYRDYWNWVSERNDQRYENTKSHGKNYDSKNMMHTFRLLHMAIEIAEEKQVHVYRKDRDFLLKIKEGQFEYDELLKLASEKQAQMESAFELSDLPEAPDLEYIKELAYHMRNTYYNQ